MHINTSRLSLSPLLPKRIGNLKLSVVKADSSSSRMEEKLSQPSSTVTLSAPLNIFIVSPKGWRRCWSEPQTCVRSHDARCWLVLMLLPLTGSFGDVQMQCWLQPQGQVVAVEGYGACLGHPWCPPSKKKDYYSPLEEMDI